MVMWIEERALTGCPKDFDFIMSARCGSFFRIISSTIEPSKNSPLCETRSNVGERQDNRTKLLLLDSLMPRKRVSLQPLEAVGISK